MARLCVVASTDMTIKAFLLDQLKALSERFDLTVIANTDDTELLARNGIAGAVCPVRIQREISLIADIRAAIALYRLMRKHRFDAVHSITPKAGLLTMMVGFLARVPFRTHTFTGQVWVTRSGLMRLLLKTLDRLIALFSTHLLVDSPSQREFLLSEGVISERKSHVLGRGSVSGVDTARFRPDAAMRRDVRDRLGISHEEVLVLFVGRLNQDKGVLDLATAFSVLQRDHQNVRLLFVGPDEGRMRRRILDVCRDCSDSLQFVEFTGIPETYFAASDVFCLPSYREGFGSVIIEAAAAGVPSVASRIYGVVDAVVEGETGILYQAGNCSELAAALAILITDSMKREQMGMAARERALREFPTRRLTDAFMEYYTSLFANKATGHTLTRNKHAQM